MRTIQFGIGCFDFGVLVLRCTQMSAEEIAKRVEEIEFATS